ncbi:MAG: ribosome-associated translation inhibitor RaiA [Pseudomonadota bacterium]
MQIEISGHHLDLSEALKNRVHSKLAKLEKHFDRITSISVVLTHEKGVQKAEAKLHVSGADLFAQAEHDDMYAAIDAMSEKLDRQIIKHKEKIKSHKAKRSHIDQGSLTNDVTETI